MGWMSWEIFRCNLATPTDDCSDKSTTKCISEALYQGQADAMVSQGFANAGYASIHMDVRARAPLILLLSSSAHDEPLERKFLAAHTLTGLLGGEEPGARPLDGRAARRLEALPLGHEGAGRLLSRKGPVVCHLLRREYRDVRRLPRLAEPRGARCSDLYDSLS